MLATALDTLHFIQCLDAVGPLSQDMVNIMDKLHTEPSPTLLENIEQNTEYSVFIGRYVAYKQQTLAGHHGSTVQY